MASAKPKPLQQVLRGVALAGATALTLAFAPGLSVADPNLSGSPGTAGPPVELTDVEAKVSKLGQELEVVTEQYNGANIALTEKKAAQRAAQAKAASLTVQIQGLSHDARQMASSAYRSVPPNQVFALLTSDSPEDLLDQLSSLDLVAQRKQQLLTSLSTARDQADAANQAATDAAADAQRIVDDLSDKKEWIEQQLPIHQKLLAQLSAEQRPLLDTGAGGQGAAPAPPVTAPDVPASGKAKIAVDAALSRLGSPYVWAAEGPDTFDCSGLTMWAWAKAGVPLPHQSRLQSQEGTPVSRDQLQPGDLVFFHNPISHVGMYIGDNQMVHAPQPGDVVKISSVDSSSPYAGATRVG